MHVFGVNKTEMEESQRKIIRCADSVRNSQKKRREDNEVCDPSQSLQTSISPSKYFEVPCYDNYPTISQVPNVLTRGIHGSHLFLYFDICCK